ncbi:hypothetical protein GH714_028746 [Hevea brasiliensis]|uniref:NPH3 domain-containing protein n=1 Tax=Hevea brasiliensis TaxID=3981 RepID=A0A6A6LJW6_HEVBR|nr:hypothetical protein GH714_028746 [Hevea brasiliensis]
MKFMKLGSRPDTFYTAEAVRSVSSEVSSDLIIQVKGSRYLLHKHQIIQLPDFPGGIEAFELCAKFCYGITITLSDYNIVAARCAAEYLQMTEDVEKGNLICKLEVFFNSCILNGWKDSIVCRALKNFLCGQKTLELQADASRLLPQSFLLKLLKAANILNASSSSKMELARRVGLQLEEATVNDLLIPSFSYASDTLYDVDLVMTILEQFMLQGQSPPTSPPRSKLGFERRRSRSAENIDLEFQESRRSSSASHSSKLKVAKVVDGYLQEIARDVNLPLSKFIALAESIPDFARLDHDDLYRAIDIYLKSSYGWRQSTELPSNIKALLASHKIDPSRPTAALSTTTSFPAEDQWSVSGLKSPKSKLSSLRMKLAEDDDLDENDLQSNGLGRTSKFKTIRTLPTRPKRMFSKLLSINRSASEKN